MGVLLSRIESMDSVQESTIDNSMVLEETAMQHVNRFYLETMDEYNQLILENMQAIHIGMQANNREIITEGLGDIVSGILQWLKKWLIRFKNFIVKCLKRLWAFFHKGKALADHYIEHPLPFKEYTVQGYKYTIPDADIPIQSMDEYLNQVSQALGEIVTSDLNTISAKTVRWENELSGEYCLAQIRGKMIGKNTIEAGHWKNALEEYFRDNKKDKEEMTMNSQKVLVMCKEYKRFEKLLKSTEKNRDEMETGCRGLAAFVDREPSYYSELVEKSLRMNGKVTIDKDFVAPTKDKAVSRFLTAVNLTIKQLMLVYDKYYAAKIDALKEAIIFYSKQINRAVVESKAYHASH